jgi:serine/threonine protein kinase
MHAPPPSDITTEGFFRAILKSGLLDEEQLRTALREMPEGQAQEPLLVSEHLIRTGRLSRFQAHKLLKGQTGGLRLGPFEILERIGRGGMGTVCLARDSRDNQLVALKVLPPRQAREQERHLARFRREMEISRDIAHPHIARTYEVGAIKDVHYLAMEFVPGSMSLSRLVDEKGPLPVPTAARLMAEVCRALEHLHQRGLIHRDVKPGNILVTPNGHAKLLDLGLALRVGEEESDISVLGGQGYIVGSMDYISPEQSMNAVAIDGRADLYSLGCTLYYALSGEPPFPKEGTSREKIHRHRDQEPMPLRERVPSVPAGFSDLVGRLMAKLPGRRFQTPGEAGEALLPWAGPAAGPLETPGDPAYTEAVRSLCLEERSTESLLLEVPSESGEIPEARSDWMWTEPGLPGPVVLNPDETLMRWVVLLTLAGTVVVLGCLGLLGLLW